MEVTPGIEFARRLHEVCDDMKLPKRGRMSALGKKFGVSYQAVKKWLDGIGYPKTETVVAIASWAEVNVSWLLQGLGPKRGQHGDSRLLSITEGISELPDEDRQQVLDFIGYKFSKADGWFTGEKLARYLAMIDRISKSPKSGN